MVFCGSHRRPIAVGRPSAALILDLGVRTDTHGPGQTLGVGARSDWIPLKLQGEVSFGGLSRRELVGESGKQRGLADAVRPAIEIVTRMRSRQPGWALQHKLVYVNRQRVCLDVVECNLLQLHSQVVFA